MTTGATTPALMTVADLAEYTGVPATSWNLLRAIDAGPRSMQLGDQTVYRLTDFDAWQEQWMVSEGGARAELKAAIGRVIDELLDVGRILEQVTW